MKQLVKPWLFYIFISIFTLFFVHRLLFFQQSFLERVASHVSYPLLHVQQWCIQAQKAFSDFFALRSHMRARIAELEQKYQAVQAEYIQCLAQATFIQDTAELQDYAARYNSSEGHIARILQVVQTPTDHYMYVAGGSKQHITQDMVAVYKNMLVGRVVNVYPWYSKVQLLTDQCTKIGVKTDKSQVQGVFEGLGQEHGSMQYVSHVHAVSKDELLVSTGKGLVYPEGFGVGRITGLEKQGMHYSITISPLCNPRELTYVMLIGLH